jgi:hypothetical protein
MPKLEESSADRLETALETALEIVADAKAVTRLVIALAYEHDEMVKTPVVRYETPQPTGGDGTIASKNRRWRSASKRALGKDDHQSSRPNSVPRPNPDWSKPWNRRGRIAWRGGPPSGSRNSVSKSSLSITTNSISRSNRSWQGAPTNPTISSQYYGSFFSDIDVPICTDYNS